MNIPELETLSYKPKAKNKESVPEQPDNSKCRHCGACRIVRPAGEWQFACKCNEDDKIYPPEQPNTNAMIFEQANGSIKVTLELLEQLETKNTNEETQKHGCIWTLKGWHDNNLKHLQKAIE